jgi:AraC-like DNA-binding protein
MSGCTDKLTKIFDLGKIARYNIHVSAEHPITADYKTLRKELNLHSDMHYALELGFVLSGRLKRYYQRWQTELEPGQVWLCGIWEPHCFEIVKAPCRAIVCQILPEMLAETSFPEFPSLNWLLPFTAPPQKRPQVKKEGRDIFLSLGRRILDVLKRGGKSEKILLRFLLLETITELCRGWSFSRRGGNPPNDGFSIINRAVEMVFKSRELIPVYQAARACGLNKPAFTMLFAKIMGIGFADFSLRYRLSGAKEQLLHSHDPVKTIASSWGFTDKSHFHHVFQRYYGCTPAEFRKKAN